MEYPNELENGYIGLASDTVFIKSEVEQGQRVITWHNQNDTAVLKRLIHHNYYSSYVQGIYLRTEYFSYTKKCLGWTHKDFDNRILACQLNYYDKTDNLIESFYWGSGEIGLRTEYVYDSTGHIKKEIKYRGGNIIEKN